MRRLLLGLAIAVVLVGAGGYGWLRWYAWAAQDPAFFEDDIRAFEAEPAPPPGGVVFVGSSSIRLWSTLAQDMAPLPVVNRGFGGSQLDQVVFYAPRIVVPPAPRAVVVYAGDNDLDAATGKTARTVADDFDRLVELLEAALPQVRIYYLAIKPSKLRWDRWPEMRRANQAIAARCAGDPHLTFVDVATPLLGPDGKPRDDVFRFDGLHLNATGYALWTAVLRPILLADLGATPPQPVP